MHELLENDSDELRNFIKSDKLRNFMTKGILEKSTLVRGCSSIQIMSNTHNLYFPDGESLGIG